MMNIILFLSALITLSHADIKYTEHFVRLGDPWSVECNTPYKEPPSWYFLSAGKSYNYFIYNYGRLLENVKTKYNVTSSNNGQISRLEVSKTDKDHAGYYGCWPNPYSLDGRQFFKLIIIEYSHIEIFLNENRSLTLHMNISYLGHDVPKPKFQCKFSFGEQLIDDKNCGISDTKFSFCKLEKLFDMNDDIPKQCVIFFNNVNFKKWEEKVFLVEPKTQVFFVKKGAPWNVRCDTPSYYSMMWLFHSFKSNNGSIVLYSKWTPNEQFYDRYHFNVSNDRRVYDMIIPRVDLNHSGTYMCTHKSSDHLIERKIDLCVIEETVINLVEKLNILTVFVDYTGNKCSSPLFKCDFNNGKALNMSNLECRTIENGLTRCQLIETYVDNKHVPEKCYISFEDETVDAVNLINNNSSNGLEVFEQPLYLIIIVVLVISIAGVVLCFIRRKNPLNFVQIKKDQPTKDEKNLLPPCETSDTLIPNEDEKTRIKNRRSCVGCKRNLSEVDMYLDKELNDDNADILKCDSVDKSGDRSDNLCIRCRVSDFNDLENLKKILKKDQMLTTPTNLFDDQINISNKKYLIEFKSYKIQNFNDKEKDLIIKLAINNNIESKRVHKKIISECCPTIKEKLQKMKSGRPTIDLTNLNGKSVLQVIDWVYSKSLEINENTVECLLEIAKHLKINEVSKKCLDYICTNLTHSNCAKKYNKFNYKDLYIPEKITNYIVSNFYVLMNGCHLDSLSTEDIIKFASHNSLEFLRNNTSELVPSEQEFKLLETVEAYLKRTNKHDFWFDFLTKSIRLGFFNADQLQNLIENQSWLGISKNKDKCIKLLNRLVSDRQKKVTTLQYPIWNRLRNWSYGFSYSWSKMKASNGYHDVKQIISDDVNSEQQRNSSVTALVIVKQITVWYTCSTYQRYIEGMEVSYNSGNTYKHGNTSLHLLRTSSTINLQEDELINQINFKCSQFIDSLTFHTSLGRTFGPYGGDGGREGQSKPLEPGGFLAGIRTQVFGRHKPDVMSSIEFCWGNVISKSK